MSTGKNRKGMDLVNPNEATHDHYLKSLRPSNLDGFIGQVSLIEKLKLAMEAAKKRKEPVDHILLAGPPGLGKTSIAYILSNQSEHKPTIVSAPMITKVADLLEILTKLEPNSVLFVDEFHRFNIKVEEFLHSAMEDFHVHIKRKDAQVTIPISPFSLIGATTQAGKIASPVRDRFGIVHTMKFYEVDELTQIIEANADKIKVKIGDKVSVGSIAMRSRGTPRIANRLLRRVRDYAQVYNNNKIDSKIVDKSLELEGIDKFGLTELDRDYLRVLVDVYLGGPVGVEALAASIGEDKNTVAEQVEPYLMRVGFLARTKRGRELTQPGEDYVQSL